VGILISIPVLANHAPVSRSVFIRDNFWDVRDRTYSPMSGEASQHGFARR
jgi:hypothetical protein